AMDGYEVPTDFKILGRGGTDFRPVFKWVEQHAPVAVVLYATDGVVTFPEKGPGGPVIWLHLNTNHPEAKQCPCHTT
ncbi:MAG: VWA-like domain-containing protein, partial [Betaproteobacteria bacterium]